MAIDKAVDSTQLDADLTSVANAIRTKGGTSAPLAFPSGFVSAVGAIPTGGTEFDDFINGTIIPLYSSDNVTTIHNSAFYGFGIHSVRFPNCVNVGSSAFYNSGLTSVYLPKVASIGATAFRNNRVPYYVLPALTTLGSGEIFSRGAASLQGIDLGAINISPPTIGANCFYDSSNTFNILILRYNAIVTLNNINAFSSTAFASGRTGGTLYVPSSLVSSYQSATNWSTILGYTNNQIKSIESTHTDPTAPIDLTLYYADGTPIT